jgi:hypothetical protein
MKKSLSAIFAFMFIFCIGSTSVAATSPVADIPATQWSYDAVKYLAQVGIIDGYGDGTFRGDKTVTRYEMAQIVYKAMLNEDKANIAQKALIDKLASEYALEMNKIESIDTRLGKVEKKIGNFILTGDARFRYAHNWTVDDKRSEKFQHRIRLNAAGDVADNIVFNGTWLTQNTNDSAATGQSTIDQTEMSVGKFTFQNVAPRADLSVGRDLLTQGATTMTAGTSGYYDRVRLTFGNELSGWVAYGDVAGANGPCNDNGGYTTKDTFTSQLQWSPSKVTTLYAFTENSKTKAYPYDIYGFGLSTKTGSFTIAGDYANNHAAATGNVAWYASLWYKGANKAIVGSYGLFVDYRSMGTNSIDMNLSGLNITNSNTKGFGYGFNYAIAKNIVFLADFELLKRVDNNASHDNSAYIKTEFWF